MDFLNNFVRSNMNVEDYGHPWICKRCSSYILVEERLLVHASICRATAPENLDPENTMEDPDRPTANKESPELNEAKIQLEDSMQQRNN